MLKQNPELGTLTPEVLESLLGSKLEVPPESFLKLMQDRAHVVQKELLRQGQFGAERLLLIAPNPVTTGFQGETRVNLSLN